jgi:hypothetical protein
LTFRTTFLCANCGKTTAFRVQIGYRKVEPVDFACQECQNRFRADLQLDQERGEVLGYKNLTGATIVSSDTFDFIVNYAPDFAQSVDSVNADFVSSFIESSNRHGRSEEFLDRLRRQQLFLEIAHGHSNTIRRMIRNFELQNWEHFDKDAKPYFQETVGLDDAVARYAALSYAMEHYVAPLFGREVHLEMNHAISQSLNNVASAQPDQLRAFLRELAATGYLREAQENGFQLYLRTFDLANDLRQILPEWDASRPESVDIPELRVTGYLRFNEVKSTFIDAHEFLSRILTLVTGLENIAARGDHNAYAPHPRRRAFRPTSIRDFHAKSHAPKPEMATSQFGLAVAASLESSLRNKLGHFTAHLEERTGVIRYSSAFPSGPGLVLDYGSFLLRLLRLLLRVNEANQLVKVLFVAAAGASVDIP